MNNSHTAFSSIFSTLMHSTVSLEDDPTSNNMTLREKLCFCDYEYIIINIIIIIIIIIIVNFFKSWLMNIIAIIKKLT